MVCQWGVLHELAVVRLTVIVMARHVELCWRSRGICLSVGVVSEGLRSKCKSTEQFACRSGSA
jgi:hypothetical protein